MVKESISRGVKLRCCGNSKVFSALLEGLHTLLVTHPWGCEPSSPWSVGVKQQIGILTINILNEMTLKCINVRVNIKCCRMIKCLVLFGLEILLRALTLTTSN